MSIDNTPQSDQDAQPTERREITVSVPEDRVEQFQAFYERFIAVAEKQDERSRAGRGSRVRRRGYHRHHVRRAMFHLAMAEHGPGSHHGHCGGHRHGDDAAEPETEASA